MDLRIFTQGEFDALTARMLSAAGGSPLEYPTGDYTQVDIPRRACRFGKGSRFGSYAAFADGSVFEGCSFRSYTRFGNLCALYDCAVGNRAVFGVRCVLKETSIGYNSRFGSVVIEGNVTIGTSGDFRGALHINTGARLELEGGHPIAKTGRAFLTLTGAGSVGRTSYFYNFEHGVHVRAGCFFGTLEDFRAEVRATHAPNSIPWLQYLGFANIAAATFGGKIEH